MAAVGQAAAEFTQSPFDRGDIVGHDRRVDQDHLGRAVDDRVRGR
ncbi:hypothetical protein [Actinoplanes sp. NPDC049265]